MCERCEQLLEENSQLVEEVSGLMLSVRQQGRIIGSLKRELTQMREDSPHADLIRRTLTYWHRRLNKSERVKISLVGRRADAVVQAIKWGYATPEELKAVVDGLALAPFEVYGVRRASGVESSRKDDLVHAFKDEHTIETLIALAAPHVRPGEQTSLNGDGS